jgi:transcription antitermination factor NusG
VNPWYAIHCRSCCEFHVERELQRHHIETYLPTRTRKGFRNSVVELPLLPPYVFARADTVEIYGVLRFTGWLIEIVGTPRGPLEIPADQVELLKLMVSRPKVEVVKLEDVWKGGEDVEITSGAFQGRRGRVAMVKGKTRLIIVLEALGRAVSVELEAEDIRIVPELPKAA